MFRRAAVMVFAVLAHATALAPLDAPARERVIEEAEQAKFEALKPAAPGKAEAYVARISDMFLSGQMHWHAFWQNAYSGGGFTIGAGYTRYVSSYNWIDVRGSITPSGYKRLEAQVFAPDPFKRRRTAAVLGGWREATQVNFFGIGPTTPQENRTNFGFTQPYLGATLEVFPTRKLFMVRGDVEVSQWNQGPASGSVTSIEQVYTPQTLPRLGAPPTYLHTHATVG